MKVLASGDKHLGLVSDGMERLEEQARILDRCFELVVKEDPEVYVDLGDLFHHPRPGPAAYELAVNHLGKLHGWAHHDRTLGVTRRAFILAGNHDKPTRGGNHALRPVLRVADLLGGVEVIEAPEVRRLEEVDLLFLPFITDWEAAEWTDLEPGETHAGDAAAYLDHRVAEALEEISGRPFLAFTHLEVPGATYGKLDTVQRDVGLKIPGRVLEAENLVRVYAGHVHRYQELERVTVVGSALHVDFGEADDPKGLVAAEVKL